MKLDFTLLFFFFYLKYQQVHSEEVELLDEEELEKNDASLTSMDLGVPETEGTQEESVVIRHEDFVELDRAENLTKKELRDKKVTQVLFVCVCYRSYKFV